MTNVTNIETNSDLTAESGSLAGRTTFPPETTANRITDRTSASYPVIPVPPTPTWNLDATSTAIPGGAVTPFSIQLFWNQNVGTIPAGSLMPPLPPTASADPNNKGSKGVEGLGIGGTNIYVNGASTPSLRIRGSGHSTIMTGFYVSGVWTPIAPNTTYTIKVESCYPNGVLPGPYIAGPNVPSTLAGTGSGNKSATLTVTTPQVSSTLQQVTTPPANPGGFTLTAPVPAIVSSAGSVVALSWNRISGATGYQVWDNNTVGDDLTMDPSNPGFYIGDHQVGSNVSQPALPATTVTFNTPAYQLAGTPFRLKVRAYKTDSNGTAYSAFSPNVNGTIPPASAIPAVPPAPTVVANSSPAHSMNITVNASTIGPGQNSPLFYRVFNNGTFLVQLTPAQIATPYVLQLGGSGVNVSITVVAGNNIGNSAASTAGTGTST